MDAERVIARGSLKHVLELSIHFDHSNSGPAVPAHFLLVTILEYLATKAGRSSIRS